MAVIKIRGWIKNVENIRVCKEVIAIFVIASFC